MRFLTLIIVLFMCIGGTSCRKTSSATAPKNRDSIAHSAFWNDSVHFSGSYTGMLVTEYSDMGGNHSKDTAYNSHYVITLTDSNTMVIRWGNSNTVDTIFRQQNPVDSSKRADMSFIGWNSKLFSPLVYNVYYYNQQDSMYMNIFTTWSNSHTNYDFYGKK